jgi:hypothetical protein
VKNEKTHFFGYDIKEFFRKNYIKGTDQQKRLPECTESHGTGEGDIITFCGVYPS